MKHFRHIAILVVSLALSANARPQLVQSYGVPQGAPLGNPSNGPIGQESISSGVLGTGYGRPCNGDEVRNVLGECVLPEISRNIFVYAAPKAVPSGPRQSPALPKPEVHYNFVFVKTADPLEQDDPIIVPPPQQKTLVYVLSKKQVQGGDEIIQAPHFPAPRPEVFYVNYGEGDNPQLPGGVDLQTALSSGATQGQNLNFQNPNFGTNQNQGNFVPNILDGGSISGGLVSPVGQSPAIDGGFIDGGIVSGGLINPGFGGPSLNQVQANPGFGGVSLNQAQADSAFGQGGFVQPASPVILQNPPSSQGTIGIQAPPSSSPGYSSQTPTTPFDISTVSATLSPNGSSSSPSSSRPASPRPSTTPTSSASTSQPASSIRPSSATISTPSTSTLGSSLRPSSTSTSSESTPLPISIHSSLATV